MRTLHIIALILAVIGAINWGLIGFFDFDLIAAIFGGEEETWSRIVYCIVGIAGLVLLATSSALFAETSPSHRHYQRQHPAI